MMLSSDKGSTQGEYSYILSFGDVLLKKYHFQDSNPGQSIIFALLLAPWQGPYFASLTLERRYAFPHFLADF